MTEKKYKIQILYCTGCGEKLIPFIDRAGNYRMGYMYLLNYSDYDKTTGKKQVMIAYKCPNRRWWTQKIDHDYYGMGPVINEEEALKLFII